MAGSTEDGGFITVRCSNTLETWRECGVTRLRMDNPVKDICTYEGNDRDLINLKLQQEKAIPVEFTAIGFQTQDTFALLISNLISNC